MAFSKRLEEARKAYEQGDQEASALAHTPKAITEAAEQHGGAGSQYLGEMVYGGLDGIITTFAVVSGVAGAQLGTPVILILGLANLLADGFSMATGAYLSTKSEHEYYRKEWEREAYEVEHFPDGERAELQEVYVNRGYTDEEARQLVEIQSREPNRWVKAMMIDELGMMEDESNPLDQRAGDVRLIRDRRSSAVDQFTCLGWRSQFHQTWLSRSRSHPRDWRSLDWAHPKYW